MEITKTSWLNYLVGNFNVNPEPDRIDDETRLHYHEVHEGKTHIGTFYYLESVDSAILQLPSSDHIVLMNGEYIKTPSLSDELFKELTT